MAAPGEDHRQAALVGGGDHFARRAPSRPAARRQWRRRRQSHPGRHGTGRTRPTRPRTPQRSARRLHHGDLHGVDAAHLSGADCQRAIRGGEDHRVRLDVRADPPRETQRRPFLGRRLPLRDDLRDDSSGSATASLALRSRDRAPAPARRRGTCGTPFDRGAPAHRRASIASKSAVTTRRFCLAARISRARLVNRRRDHRLDERRLRARSPSRRRADGSARRCRRRPTAHPRHARARRRRRSLAPVATPHGLVCLITAPPARRIRARCARRHRDRAGS